MNGEREVLRRSFEVPLEAREGRILEGCVVPYGEAAKVSDGGPAYYEVFEPGVFRRQMKDGAAQRIELRYEHRDGLADSVGICRRLYEEAHGLFGEFCIHAGAFGDQALELVRSKILPGFSVEFSDRYQAWKRVGETVVRQSCELHSVGLVRKPAYTGALVVAMRSKQEWAELLELPLAPDEEYLERLRAVGVTV